MGYFVLHSGAWKPGRPHPLVGGVWTPAQRVWMLRRMPGPIDPPEYGWQVVGDWRVPDLPVPGVRLVKGFQITPPTAQVTWTSVGDSGDPRYDYQVRVEWYRNGLLEDIEQRAQITGQTPFREFTEGDAVFARVQYLGPGGGGPMTQTDTLHL